MENVDWNPKFMPNASFTSILGILKNCPARGQGILFGLLKDIRPDPIYGFRLEYQKTEDGSES